MPRPRRTFTPVLRALPRAACWLTLLFGLGSPALLAAPADEKIVYLQNLPAANPYRAALLRLAELPPEQRRPIEAWINHQPTDTEPAPTLEPAQRALIREITASVTAAIDSPPATAELWPLHPDTVDPDNPLVFPVPPLGLVRELARLTVRAADELPPGESIPVYAAAAQLARQHRAGGTLIAQLTAIAIEGAAFSGAARRLDEFSRDELHQLSAAWSRLHALPTLEECFAGERNRFFVPIVEKVIRPGLHALLAEPAEADLTLDPDAGFTRSLRLSGLMDYGNGRRGVSLENLAAKISFSLREGGPPVDGIRLLKIDFEQRQAVIRRGTREAIIHLESKEIVEQRAAAEHLLKYFGDYEQWSGEGTGEHGLKRFLDQARAYPGGVDAYADELIARYDRALAGQIAAAESPRFPSKTEVAIESPAFLTDPFVALTMPTFGQVGRTLQHAATQPQMLEAAIRHRLAALGHTSDASAPADPWADEPGAPFLREAAPDGGFLLRSRYETSPGTQLTYKFAAPDAGFIRTAK